MRSLNDLARVDDKWGEVSLRQLAAEHGTTSLTELVRIHDDQHGRLTEPLVFRAQIVTGGLAALGGDVTVTINPDGSVRWQGHAHDSGLDGYDFTITAVIRGKGGTAIALTRSGRVGGTLSSDSSDYDWDELDPPRQLLVTRGREFVGAQLETNLQYESDLAGVAEEVVAWVVRWSVGTGLGPAGAVIFVGLNVGSLIGSGEVAPGARLAEGILWMAGPQNTLFAVISAGLAELGSQGRELSVDEYNWANGEVFKGALPPRDRLWVTDTIGGGDRPFVWPGADEKITINVGGRGFADVRTLTSGDKPYGYTLIHELVHTCQAFHTTDLSYVAAGIASTVCAAGGEEVYHYGMAGGQPYSSFGLEQQAQLVADWWVGKPRAKNTKLTNHTSVPHDVNSPYYPYIEALRRGEF